ncbi:DUF4167 domain-containing protein [Sphingobium sp.]|uniref:DUF4167 domain-containing protein n=1 Tax=Sphingobium sp. TaxID=1912891 RepID=UPI003B3A0432
MINNRQAGRRNRGRNNNNGRPNGNNRGGGDNGNRIDSRARGNAAQLLEKYKNMARDAQMAGDRVNAEYYLQFADHYFRVLADNRARQEEQQQRFRPRDDNFDEDGDEFDGGFEGNDDFRADRQDEGRETREPRENREPREGRNNRRDRPRRDRFVADGDAPQQEMGVEGPTGNPATEARAKPNLRPRADAQRDVEAPSAPQADASDAEVEAPRPRRGRPRKAAADVAPEANEGFDMTVLPPSIARADNDAETAEEAPKKRTRRPRAAAEAAE